MNARIQKLKTKATAKALTIRNRLGRKLTDNAGEAYIGTVFFSGKSVHDKNVHDSGIKNRIVNMVFTVREKAYGALFTCKRELCSLRGEGYVDTVLKLLISVVLGTLLLVGLYALFNDTVMPRLTTEVEAIFDYNGN